MSATISALSSKYLHSYTCLPSLMRPLPNKPPLILSLSPSHLTVPLYIHSQLRTYHEVIDEIYNKVTNVEPWATGTSRLPSTAFCLLMKFFTMRLTRKQITGLLNHQDSPYIRCIGFLYLRYVCDPKEIWQWISPYIDDEEEFAPSSDPNNIMYVSVWLHPALLAHDMSMHITH